MNFVGIRYSQQAGRAKNSPGAGKGNKNSASGEIQKGFA
jgi:hypothetical protein